MTLGPLQHQAGNLLFRQLGDQPFIELWECDADGKLQTLVGHCEPNASPMDPPRSDEELAQYADWFLRGAAGAVIKDRTGEGDAAPAVAPKPSTDVENSAEPKYPAELLDDLANALACEIANPMGRCDSGKDALDRYTQEVGRENVSTIVARAVAS